MTKPTPHYRPCALGLVPPTKEIFGKVYGQCALAHECPADVVCAYASVRRLLDDPATLTPNKRWD
jgi:hypothetical protein